MALSHYTPPRDNTLLTFIRGSRVVLCECGVTLLRVKSSDVNMNKFVTDYISGEGLTRRDTFDLCS